jgi:beta-lactamase regulating signal transducer with metallopeptidase domain
MFESYLVVLSQLVIWLAITSLKALPLIILIVVLRKTLLNKLPAIARHYLWVSVLLCLTLPLGWTINIGINDPATDGMSSNPAERTLGKPTGRDTATINNKLQSLADNRALPATTGSHNPGRTVLDWFSLLWLVGVMVLGLMTLLNLKKYHQIKKNAAAPSPAVLTLFETCKQTLNPGKNVQVLQSADINTPIVMGWLAPVLLIPDELELELDQKELRFVFLHEMAHVKRQDILFNWMVNIVQILHWFNPILWLCSRLIRTDMEASCDAMVLSKLSQSDRHPYGNTLIKLAEFLPPTPPSAHVVGILENHVELTERLKMICKSNPVNLKMASLVGLLLTASAALALTQPSNSANNKEALKSIALSDPRSIELGHLADMLELSFDKKVLVGTAHTQAAISMDMDVKTITYSDFLSILKVNGFTASEVGEHIQVFPLEDLRYSALPTLQEGISYPVDQFVTGFMTLKYACASDLIPILRPMSPRYAHMASFKSANSITLTDTYSNFIRVKNTVEKFDAQYDEKQECKDYPRKNKPKGEK